MLQEKITQLYRTFRLLHYRSLFGKIRERDGSLSATEAYAADVIFLLGNPTLREFGECLGISQPNATYKVNNLMGKGYVVKSASEEDRRECRLSVTDKFRTYYQVKDASLERAAAELKKQYSSEQLAKFEEMLGSFVSAMK